MRSSYKENDYGWIFTALAKTHKPSLIVECGVLDGYSLKNLAHGADCNPDCKIIGIDLWDDYEFKHGNYSELKKYFEEWAGKNIELRHGDALKEYKDFEDESIDILHLDVSNDGIKLQHLFNVWDSKIKKGGLLIFEGGSEERDKVDWMKEHKKVPIKYAKLWLQDKYEYVTLLPFPSLTICRKSIK